MYAPGQTNEMVEALSGELVRQVIKWFKDEDVETPEEKVANDKDNLGKIDLSLRTYKGGTVVSETITEVQVWWDVEVEGLPVPTPTKVQVATLQSLVKPDDIVVQAMIETHASMPDGAVCRHKVVFCADLLNAAGFKAQVRASAAMKHAVVEVEIGPQPLVYLIDPENSTAFQLLGAADTRSSS
jgi:hypothetical protein